MGPNTVPRRSVNLPRRSNLVRAQSTSISTSRDSVRARKPPSATEKRPLLNVSEEWYDEDDKKYVSDVDDYPDETDGISDSLIAEQHEPHKWGLPSPSHEKYTESPYANGDIPILQPTVDDQPTLFDEQPTIDEKPILDEPLESTSVPDEEASNISANDIEEDNTIISEVNPDEPQILPSHEQPAFNQHGGSVLASHQVEPFVAPVLAIPLPCYPPKQRTIGQSGQVDPAHVPSQVESNGEIKTSRTLTSANPTRQVGALQRTTAPWSVNRNHYVSINMACEVSAVLVRGDRLYTNLNRSMALAAVVATGPLDHSRPPFKIKVTGYRILNVCVLSVFGTWKGVASYQGKAIISNTLDIVLGVGLALFLLVLGWYEPVQIPCLAWLFKFDVDYAAKLLSHRLYSSHHLQSTV